MNPKTESEFRLQFPPGLYVMHSKTGQKALVQVEHIGCVTVRNALGLSLPVRDLGDVRIVRATLEDVTPAKGIL